MLDSLQKEDEAVILTAGAISTAGVEVTTISAHATATTIDRFSQGEVTMGVSMETSIGAEAAATTVSALALFVGQRGIKPSNAPKLHKQQFVSPGDLVNPMRPIIGHHQRCLIEPSL